MQPTLRSSRTYGLVLCAAFALAAIGLAVGPRRAALGPQDNDDPPAPPVTGRPNATFPVTGMADSNGSMIAVTGIDMTGTSILYLVDTQNRQLAVYQASGGTDSMQGLKLVGARRIDLDLQLYGFNDKSEYTYEDLKKKFTESTTPVPRVK